MSPAPAQTRGGAGSDAAPEGGCLWLLDLSPPSRPRLGSEALNIRSEPGCLKVLGSAIKGPEAPASKSSAREAQGTGVSGLNSHSIAITV